MIFNEYLKQLILRHKIKKVIPVNYKAVYIN